MPGGVFQQASGSPSASPRRQRVTVNALTASFYPSLQLTAMPTKDSNDDDDSKSTAASLDSFALRIDWSNEEQEKSGRDPYLAPKNRSGQRRSNGPALFGGGERSVRQSSRPGRADSSPPPRPITPRRRSTNTPPVVTPDNSTAAAFTTQLQSYNELSPDSLLALHSQDTGTTIGSSGSAAPSLFQASSCASLSTLRHTNVDGAFPSHCSVPSVGSYEFALNNNNTAAAGVGSVSSSHQSSPAVQEPLAFDPQRYEAQQRRRYWSDRVERLLATQGSDSMDTAAANMELGQACLQSLEYSAAVDSFRSALHIFRRFRKQTATAKAFQGLGVATSRLKVAGGGPNYIKAIEHLHSAFQMRRQELGVWHVDTVETINYMAVVYGLSSQWHRAVKCYWEVFWVRKAIFGATHASVAVTAHNLANGFVRLGKLLDADHFYRVALEIYVDMGLPRENPAVTKLLRDIHQLERQDYRRVEI